MQIEKSTVVTLNYKLSDESGELLEESADGSFSYIHGANTIIQGLERALDGRNSGDTFSVTVAPGDGYGERDEQLKQVVARDMFPAGAPLEVGMQFHAAAPGGEPMVVTIDSIEGDAVTVDGNHPLAGKPLTFDIEVLEVRPATEEELAHGHAHGPEGHEHD